MRIYVAGPYTKGDVAINVRNAIEAGNALLKAGHAPYIPHLTHFWHLVYPGPYEQWLALDLHWVRQCDALLRLPGESSGADGEVAEAKRLGLPVYYAVEGIPRMLDT
jgi:uncharacterized protein DUF4406